MDTPDHDPLDSLPTGPSLLEPGVRPGLGDRMARAIVIPLLILLLGVLLMLYVLFTVIRVEGDSMLPNIHDGDRLLVTRDYRRATVGDVIVFATISRMHGREDLIKRVVAVEGDSVSVRADRAFVNGVGEPVERVLIDGPDPLDVATLTVPPDNVFVLGDNRPISLDSRILGPVPLEAIKSKVLFIFSVTGDSGPADPLR